MPVYNRLCIFFSWPLPYAKVDFLCLNADGDQGEVRASRWIGPIVISGDHVLLGYRKSEHIYGVLIFDNLEYKDKKLQVYIAGRSKGMIIRSGHKIDPAMVENALNIHPAVALAATVGQPDTMSESCLFVSSTASRC